MYKFDLPKNTISFSCTHVYNEGKEILFVSHDDDGDWQFLCGDNNHEDENGVLLCLGHITEMDSSVNEIADLPTGFAAERKSKKDIWERFEW